MNKSLYIDYSYFVQICTQLNLHYIGVSGSDSTGYTLLLLIIIILLLLTVLAWCIICIPMLS